MKTAITELIEWVKEYTKLAGEPSSQKVIDKCNTLIETEAEQIKDAYRAGMMTEFPCPSNVDEIYYKAAFKTVTDNAEE